MPSSRKIGAKQTAYLLDPAGKVGHLYGAKTTPHMYVIDAQGVLRYMGGIDSIAEHRQGRSGQGDAVRAAGPGRTEGRQAGQRDDVATVWLQREVRIVCPTRAALLTARVSLSLIGGSQIGLPARIFDVTIASGGCVAIVTAGGRCETVYQASSKRGADHQRRETRTWRRPSAPCMFACVTAANVRVNKRRRDDAGDRSTGSRPRPAGGPVRADRPDAS